MNDKHVIIGANGPIGGAISNILENSGKQVIRTGRAFKQENNYLIIDALNEKEVLNATKKASHIYVTIGLNYNHKVWQRDWPIIIENVINAARTNHSKIIFFDNIYIYGPELMVPITETHSKEPISKKGKVRKIIFDALNKAMSDVKIMIVRAPDFFGPNAKSSIIHSAFLENMIVGKRPMFFGNDSKKHSYAYTIDLATAVVLLALEEDTYNQEWHLPTYQTNNIYEIVKEYNKCLNSDLKLSFISKRMQKILSIFVPILKEVYEMRYQFESDYVLNFDKFSKRFPNFKQTKFEDAVKITVTSFLNN